MGLNEVPYDWLSPGVLMEVGSVSSGSLWVPDDLDKGVPAKALRSRASGQPLRSRATSKILISRKA